MARASKLIRDLSNVPSIISNLGLGVASAQKVFNLDYLENLENLLVIIRATLGATKTEGGADLDAETKEKLQALEGMLLELAPARYQFTETSLNVKLDLAQTTDIAAQVGFGAGMGAIAVNAALTLGFGFDYRAAADVRTVLHAVPSKTDVMTPLLTRAKELGGTMPDFPGTATVDKELAAGAIGLAGKLAGNKKLEKPKNIE